MPPELQRMRQGLASYVQPKIGQPATPYTGPLTPGIDPLALQAASMMMGMMNKPYNMPPYGSMAGNLPPAQMTGGGAANVIGGNVRGGDTRGRQPDPYAPGNRAGGRNPWEPGERRPRR